MPAPRISTEIGTSPTILRPPQWHSLSPPLTPAHPDDFLGRARDDGPPPAVRRATGQSEAAVRPVGPHASRRLSRAPATLRVDRGQAGSDLVYSGRLQGHQRLPHRRAHRYGPPSPALAGAVREGDLVARVVTRLGSHGPGPGCNLLGLWAGLDGRAQNHPCWPDLWMAPMDKSGRVFQDIVVSADWLYNMLTYFAGRAIRLR